MSIPWLLTWPLRLSLEWPVDLWHPQPFLAGWAGPEQGKHVLKTILHLYKLLGGKTDVTEYLSSIDSFDEDSFEPYFPIVEAKSEAMRELMTERWKDPIYHEKQTKAMAQGAAKKWEDLRYLEKQIISQIIATGN